MRWWGWLVFVAYGAVEFVVGYICGWTKEAK